MKIIPIGTVKVKKTPLHRNRSYIDSLKELIVKDHNRKVREGKPGQ